MKARPTVFLSGVSDEFRSFRDAVENEIEMKGCFAENQPGFPPGYVVSGRKLLILKTAWLIEAGGRAVEG